MLSLLREHREAFAFHGHIHKEQTRSLEPMLPPQVFCAKATVDSDVLYRLYDVEDRMIRPVVGVGTEESLPASLPLDTAIAAE